jgi:hypothetical protein
MNDVSSVSHLKVCDELSEPVVTILTKTLVLLPDLKPLENTPLAACQETQKT